MEEQKKSIPEQLIQQENNSILPVETISVISKKNWLVVISAVLLGLLIISGAIYWWILKENGNDKIITPNLMKNEEILDNIVNNNESTSVFSLFDKCSQANGIWENGKCKAKKCFDADARLGEDSKYFSYRTYYSGDISIFSEEYKKNNDEYYANHDVCGDSVLREATCPIEINTQEDFSNSYVEYKCEEGCDGNIERCKKTDYNITGLRIANLVFAHYDYNKFDGHYEAYLQPNGTINYSWGDYAPGAAILSEEEYSEIQRDIIKIDGLFVEVGDDNEFVDLKDNSYYSFENNENDKYFLQYTYYPEGLEKNTENQKIKKFVCNINCPQAIMDLFNKFEKKTPYLAASDKHWVPQFIYYDQCDVSGKDLACWYKVIATEAPTAIIGDYDMDNIFFVDIDYTLDSDNDGVPNFSEKYLGINMYSVDTDSDGYEDLQELKGGYNPVGDGIIEHSMDKLENVLETQCTNMGGTIGMVSSYNPNCWGIDNENDRNIVVNCLWTNYGYCKPEMYYCMCQDGKKVYQGMMHSFIGLCQ